MPLLSSNPRTPTEPLYPAGEGLDPGPALDPTALIKGLQDQATIKAKQWQSMTAWDRPELEKIWDQGLPSDVGYVSDQFYSALGKIEKGIRKAGGNARYYLGTDAGKAEMRRAALDPEQMATMHRELEAYKGLEKNIQESESGQELWLSRYGNPVIDPNSGQPLTINQMMRNYRTNDAYSQFYNIEGSQRDISQITTTFDEARKDVETYFNSVKPDSYGYNKINAIGLNGIYEDVRTQGFTSIANVKRIMEGNGGLHNNLSKSVMAGFSRGFNDSQGGIDYQQAGYVDPETGQYTEKYSIDKQEWIFNEVARVANEMAVVGHEEYTNIKRVPGTKNPTDKEKGFSKWDAFVENKVSVGGDQDTTTQTYIATTGDEEYQRTAQFNLRRYSVTDNVLQDKMAELVQRNTARNKSIDGKAGETLPTLSELIGDVPYAYMKYKDGTNDVMDLTKEHGALTSSQLIVYSVSNTGLEHYKPSIFRVEGREGKVQYGPMQLVEQDGKMVLDRRSLGNLHPNDIDKINETTNTIVMEILYPADAFSQRFGYSNEVGDDTKMQRIPIGKSGFGYDAQLDDRFEGIGGTSQEPGGWFADTDEVVPITYNGNPYVKINLAIPVNSSMGLYGASEEYQRQHQRQFENTYNEATQNDAQETQTQLQRMMYNYQNPRTNEEE